MAYFRVLLTFLPKTCKFYMFHVKHATGAQTLFHAKRYELK